MYRTRSGLTLRTTDDSTSGLRANIGSEIVARRAAIKLALGLLIAILHVFNSDVEAQLQVESSVVGSGGGCVSGGSFTIDTTFAEALVGGPLSAGNLTLNAGFQAGLTAAPPCDSTPTPTPSPTPTPAVTTVAATLVATTAAQLNGMANPNGDSTTGWFRYATTSPGVCNDTFGTRVPTSGGTALGSGTSGVPYTQGLTGLFPGTTYYFCAIAQNSGGSSFGSLLSFSTPALPMVQFSAATYMDDESQTATITIQRTGGTSGASSVQFDTVAGGTANAGASCTGGADYITKSMLVSFAAMETSKQVTVDLCSDLLGESPETVNLALTSPTGATLGSQDTAVLTINDTATEFRNTGQIDLQEAMEASPYPSEIVVSGAPAVIGSMRLTLYDVLFSDPDDIDILLVGPTGKAFVVMGDVGGNTPFGPVTITFEDFAGAALPDASSFATGKYEPTVCEMGQPNFPSPAPVGPYPEPNCAVAGDVTMSGEFFGTDANGTWQLYIRGDDGMLAPEGVGVIDGGWGLQFFAPTAAGATLAGRVVSSDGNGIPGAVITVAGEGIAVPLRTITNPFGYYSFGDLQSGHTYVVSVASKRYTFAQPSMVVTLNSDATDIDFTADPLE